jgi:hypothetical protein
MKYFLIIGIFFLLGLIGYLFIMSTGGGADSQVSNDTPVVVQDPSQELVEVPDEVNISQLTTPTVPLKGRNGESIEVNNFFRDEATETDILNPGRYVLAGGKGYCLASELAEGCSSVALSPYQIWFNLSSNEIVISINSEPVQENKVAAEIALQQALGVPFSTLCDLNVSFYVNNPEDLSADTELFIRGCEE